MASFRRALERLKARDDDSRKRITVDDKAHVLADYVRSLTDFRILEEADGNYHHMGATITDAVLQAGINYEHVVAPRISRLRRQYPGARTSSGFLRLLNTAGPLELLKWRHPEKPNRVFGLTSFFVESGIETETDLQEWIQIPSNVVRLKQLRGIGDKTVDYLKNLTGIPTSAIDRHLFRFLEEANIRASGYDEAHIIVDKTADLMRVSRRLLDHSIWKYMSDKSKQSVSGTRRPSG